MLKVADTPIGERLGGYALIHSDLEFSARAFGISAEVASSTRDKKKAPLFGGLDAVAETLRLADPLLRRGGILTLLDSQREPPESVVASSLFEAGVVRYARCFNSGKRTQLNKSIFSGPTAKYRKLHTELMDLRNSYLAHAGMEHEDFLVGFQHVDDPNYGNRPSTQFSLLSMRPSPPEPDKLRELSAHCLAINLSVVQPRLNKTAKALREQLLKLGEAEIAGMTDFSDYEHKVRKVFEATEDEK